MTMLDTDGVTITPPPRRRDSERQQVVDGAGGVVVTGDVKQPAASFPERSSTLSPPISYEAGRHVHSPMRHHKRTPSHQREVKETLNARSEYFSDDAEGRYRINQYVIGREMGRGSYGAVHLATDQFGNEYAVKEFSKSRLRKRAQSNMLRRPRPSATTAASPAGLAIRPSWSSHAKQFNSHEAAEAKDALFLIREEVAIMKKLNHPNLVQLIEVLDDPEEDSLYMVLEMCQKGVVMEVGLDETADPYPEEQCRHWFRDLILGIEYLHAQGVVHRDIKPDNLLLTHDDVLKIVDFGVSEIFEKTDQMMTAKPAGSPAFIPPELCVTTHGDISGKAADIWSMGVSLYCLRYGKLPFKRDGVFEMYEAIRNQDLVLPPDEKADFAHLMARLLDKDPSKRISMEELRDHAWVTKAGQDPLLSREENCADPIEPPSEIEVKHALTQKMSHLLSVMVAIHKFKALILGARRKPSTSEARTGRATGPADSIATSARLPAPNTVADEAADMVRARSAFLSSVRETAPHTTAKGQHAHQDLSDIETHFLGIGVGGADPLPGVEPGVAVVAESPTGIDLDIYDRAFADEVARIRADATRAGRTTYLTRLVGAVKDSYIKDGGVLLESERGEEKEDVDDENGARHCSTQPEGEGGEGRHDGATGTKAGDGGSGVAARDASVEEGAPVC